ncbi:unnamed protein product, partial [Heterosigma akashiwo]
RAPGPPDRPRRRRPAWAASPVMVRSSWCTSLLRKVRSALGCSPKTSGESTLGKEAAKALYSSTSWQSGTAYRKSPGRRTSGASGLKVNEGASVPGPSQASAYARNSRPSSSSVILPPYWHWPTMYCSVGQEMGPPYRCFSRKVRQAFRSPSLYS